MHDVYPMNPNYMWNSLNPIETFEQQPFELLRSKISSWRSKYSDWRSKYRSNREDSKHSHDAYQMKGIAKGILFQSISGRNKGQGAQKSSIKGQL